MLTDLRFALRLLLKSPGFSLAAIGALGFGIGLSTAVFNAFSAALLRPVPHIKDERSLVFINSQRFDQPDEYHELSMPDFLDLRATSKTLDGFTTTVNKTMIFTDGKSPPDRQLGADISHDGFAMLGVEPVRGRLFREEDAKAGAPLVVILSHALWRGRFGGSDDAVGSSVTINGKPHTIIGVMPEGFAFPEGHQLWTPMVYTFTKRERGSADFPGWARLKPGVTLDEARTEFATIAGRLAKEYPVSNEGKTFTLRLARDEATDPGMGLLMKLMLGAAIAVLLIACANVANLMLARAMTRTHEIGIRIAVGATRTHLIRQILLESLLLGLLGGGFGLLVAAWADSLLFAAVPHEAIPFWMVFDFDWRVFCFTAGAALLSPLLFGFLPALQASRVAVSALREGTRTATAGRRAALLRQGLVVAQVALSAVLLIVAGLFVRSFLKLNGTSPGFDPSGVITFRVGLPPSQYDYEAQRDVIRGFFDRLEPALAALPGVKSVGSTSHLPGNGDTRSVFVIEGRPEPATALTATRTCARIVSTGYLRAMRIPLLRGRVFTADDTRDKPGVALVDEQFADRWFPGKNPIGKRIALGLAHEGEKDRKWAEIVGIVGNVPQQFDLPYDDGGVYFAHSQNDQSFVNYVLHVAGDPVGYRQAIERAVLSVQSDIPIYDFIPMETLHARSYWQRRFFSQVFSAFGLGALFLAALGVYGVMSYAVVQRTAEIGVRMALGASEREVVHLVGRQGALLVTLGMLLGVTSALGVTRLLAGLLWGVSPSDPPTYFALTLVLAATGIVACVLPVRRAAKLEPMLALRSE